jgi:predicted esterase
MLLLHATILAALAGTAGAQCQLAFNDPPDPIPIDSLIDLSAFEGIDAANEVFTDFPTCDLQTLRTYAYSLFATGEYELQSRIYTYILRHERRVVDLYNLACCYSRMGMSDKVLEYLDYALQYGYEDIEWIEQDTDMDLVRETPRYAELLARQTARMTTVATQEGTQVHVESPILQPCNVTLPEDFDPEVSHTLVIGLHGAGDSAARFGRLAASFGENDFIYVAPQAPYPVPGTQGYVWFAFDPEDPEGLDDRAIELNLEYLDNLVASLGNMYAIDRIYIIGFSQGASMSYIAGMRRPEVYDGIVPFGGLIDPTWFTEDQLEAARGLRVFIAHGNEDNIELAQMSRDLLEDAGFDVEYHEFQGGHFIHLDTLHEAIDWIKE